METKSTDTGIEEKQNIFVKVIIIIAVIVFAFGVYIAFFPIAKWGIHYSNDGFVSAIFSLIGAVLFFGALVYQIKEYQNQLTELKLSVEAQTASSIAMQEQKEIMLQANNRELILSLIDKLIDYMENNKINGFIESTLNNCFKSTYVSQTNISNSDVNDYETIDTAMNSFYKSFKESFNKNHEDNKFKIRSFIIQIEGILNIIKNIKEIDEKVALTQLLMSNIKVVGITYYLTWRMNKMSFNRISFEWQKTASSYLFNSIDKSYINFKAYSVKDQENIEMLDKELKQQFINNGIFVLYQEQELRKNH
ncbi:MAG: hypothetical protein JXR36_13990 [Bacteroidales bacterium]|nr:hypothetical protein [Bacteroidales bacterium]